MNMIVGCSRVILFALMLFNFVCTPIQANEQIKVNQIGFYPDGEKVAVIPGEVTGEFQVLDAQTEDTVFSGYVSEPAYWSYSDEHVVLADFSKFKEPGIYRIYHQDAETSFLFEIGEHIHRGLSKASIKALYFNRASTGLPEEFAGKWARPEGHPDEEAIIHPSAAYEERPAGYTFSSPRGWYDAGDFNKYIVNSGISTYTMLAAYEHFPGYYNELNLNIPESGNNQPDLLDETRWNLDWMLTMQDPGDGGVYHKLTAPDFEPVIMPHQADSERYAVKKSTAATLNFAAVMATAARVFEDIDADFADEALEAAEYAWQWAQQNPEVYYDQAAMNEQYDPDIHTGAYGDFDVEDEFDWAAAELYITTNNDDYWYSRNFQEAETGVPDWAYVRPLAWISLAHHKENLTNAADRDVIRQRIIEQGDELLEEYQNSAYGISMGLYGQDDFVWGSNGMAGNHSVMLIQAYRIIGEQQYLDAALSNLDYMLGRNATGYSFVTGHGSNTPMYPHHRQSATDDNEEPVPGFVVGGPQNGWQDGCEYPSDLPAKSYLDDWCSYSTNEVAINWNAPLIYVSGAIEHLFQSN